MFTAEEQQQRIPWCDLMNIIKGAIRADWPAAVTLYRVQRRASRQWSVNPVPAFIGSNYIAMPYAFRQGGLTAASIGLVIIAWVTGYCCNLLVLCKRKVRALTGVCRRPRST